jgi:hypothetical protein
MVDFIIVSLMSIPNSFQVLKPIGGVNARPLLIDPLTRPDEDVVEVAALEAEDVVLGYDVRDIGVLRFDEVYAFPVGSELGELLNPLAETELDKLYCAPDKYCAPAKVARRANGVTMKDFPKCILIYQDINK